MADDGVELSGSRRRSRNGNAAGGVVGCASPRNHRRRSRRRLELEMMREEKDLGVGEEMVKARKKRHSGRSKKDKLGLVPIPSPSMFTFLSIQYALDFILIFLVFILF